jgi:hypothetical protein
MIEKILKQLSETWGYTTEELNDIRSKLEEFGNSCYIQGVADTNGEAKSMNMLWCYGKKEDQYDE